MTFTAQPTKEGICQHFQQTRKLFLHEGELQYWGYDPSDSAWLCAPDWSRREIAIENENPFTIFSPAIASITTTEES